MIKANLNITFILAALVIFGCSLANSNKEGKVNDTIISTGTKQFIWKDTIRVDNYYGGARIINVRLWYPSNQVPIEKIRTPYLLFGDKFYNKLEGWTETDFKAAMEIELNSYVDAPVKAGLNKAPLLIFSPSLGGNSSYYTYYAKYFAMNGYIVMGVNHLYESEVVIDEDSNIYPANHKFQDSLKNLKIPEEISAEKYRELMGGRQKVLAEDILFALDQLLNDPLIGNKVDENKIAVFGHSIGGAAAIYSSIIDHRIKAVINLDGTPPTLGLNNGIDVPFLFIEDLTDYRNHKGYAKMHKRRSDFCELNRADSWRILINGLSHNSFLDVNYYFANNPSTIKSEEKNLDSILAFMDDFLGFHLRLDSKLNLKEMETTEMEIIHFEK